jgi:hypothetical protein
MPMSSMKNNWVLSRLSGLNPLSNESRIGITIQITATINRRASEQLFAQSLWRASMIQKLANDKAAVNVSLGDMTYVPSK